jgi:hypothetical protein
MCEKNGSLNAIGNEMAFFGTNPEGARITAGLPVIRQLDVYINRSESVNECLGLKSVRLMLRSATAKRFVFRVDE